MTLSRGSDTSRLLTAREVAEELGLSAETVLRWTRDGRLPAFRLGSAIRYRRTDVERWLEDRAVGVERSSLTVIQGES